jgi:hypothetical protein
MIKIQQLINNLLQTHKIINLYNFWQIALKIEYVILI